METKKDIYHLWVQYTTKNEEDYFRQFIKGFVAIWETQLGLNWEKLPDWAGVKHDLGPHLSRLPEELLPAIGKFMFLATDEAEKKKLSNVSLKKAELLVQCLVVVCRNFDNIPFIASCDYVSQSVGIAATVIHQLVEEKSVFEEAGTSFFINFCHLLECLYDPYFTWRHFLKGNPADFEKLQLQPALLHVEVVPFIYDCFQTPIIECYPELSIELVHVLGAVISGAQHNALRAICPATVNIVMGIVSHSKATPKVRHTAIQCFVMMVHVLNKSSPDQRQIEVGTIIQLYQDALMELLTSNWHNEPTLCELVSALRSLLTNTKTQEHLQQIMVDNHMLDTIITVIEESEKFPFEKHNLASSCVKTLGAMLVGSSVGKERMMKTSGYERLYAALRNLGPSSRELLQALLDMVAEEQLMATSRLLNAEVLLPLIRWLAEIEANDQLWLASAVYQLCSTNLPSKTVACQKGVILIVCDTLGNYKKLCQKAANELIKLLEVLASHSIMPYELKQIFLLLREDAEEKFPYRVQLLHAVSSVARKGDYVSCSSYFDIQKETDGITVPGIRKWPGAGYGFSFHCWVRLDHIEDPKPSSPTNYRRQLFNLLTTGGTGLEAFFQPDGALVVGINTKKEFLTACVSDFPLLDGQWHCLQICHMAARRPFGQNQLTVYIDGAQRMGVGVKSPAMTDPFTYCIIGSVVQRQGSSASIAGETKLNGGEKGLLSGGMMDRGLLPSIMNQVPNYFTLPLRSSAPLDPNVKSFPAGMQDTIWGTPISLRGQIGLACLFHEALSLQQIKTLYDGGPNCCALFALEDIPEILELTSKLVFCFSPAACSNNLCLDLAPASKYDGHIIAAHCQTFSIKNVINGIGGVHVLFPILENASKSDEEPDLSFLSPTVEKECRLIEGREDSVDSDDWEILPSSSYSDWKLEQNPVSGFLSLLKNIISGSLLNQEQLLKNNGLAMIGILLAKAKPHLIDVNVLMAVQLLIEMARDAPNAPLLRSLYQHVLFNFKIWSQSQFHIRIGHIQYISTVIKDDRKFFRKKYGIQFLLDVIHQYYSSCDMLSSEDSKTIRVSLLGLVKYYMQKELNVKEVSSILGFLSSVKEEILLLEVLEMLISYMENKACKDQIYLLLYEPQSAETLYCLIVDKNFSVELKQKVLRLFSVLLRSERVYERNKARLRLQEGASSIGMYPGLIAMLQDQRLSMDVTVMLLDQILGADGSGAYAGALSLLHALSLADLELKLEAARKILTATFMKNNAAHNFAKQVGWQDCVTRLLVKKPISTIKQSHCDSLPDLMSFDEENLELEDASYSPSSVSRISTQVTDAAMVLENEIKEVAETVSNAVADNIHYAADNISSAVASAYSVFRQKTVEMQESLEELGESAVSRLKQRRSLISLYETQGDREGSPRPVRTPQLLASLGLDLDTLSLGNRSGSSSSTEDLSSPNQNDSVASNKEDSISISSAQSISTISNKNEEENEESDERESRARDALQHWKELDIEKLVDQEEELCYLVINILFTILWRGVEGASKDAWKERGQVMACINLLGLNNELYCSHLQLKLKILEMGVQASLSDLRDVGQTNALSTHAENAVQLMSWIYDLVVLDPNEDSSKKASTKLLDGVLGLLDALLVFQEGPGEEWTEMAKLAFGILLSCAANTNLELCAMATAKLHALIQTRNMKDPEEGSYLLYFMNRIVQKTIEVNNQEHYSFLIPVVKALLEKLSTILALSIHLPDLPQTQAGPAFFDDFQAYCQESQWKTFIEKKVRPLHDAYQAALSGQLTEAMNVFWAECYESSKTAVHRRNREVGESKLRFQSQVLTPFRLRQTEDSVRYNNLVNQQRNHELLVRRKWRHLKQFFIGSRGAWQSRKPIKTHWKLSHHENFSRMRLKLCPSLTFDPHTDASNLRDNTGWLSRMQSAEEIPLSLNISAAVRGETEEENLLEEELRMASEAETEGAENSGKEKLVISQECELVTLMSVVRGRLDVTTSHFYFYDLSPVKEDVERQDFKWALSRLREIHLRRYNLRRSALEFFLTDQTNYFLNFSTKTRNKVFTRILSLRPPNLYHYGSRTPADLLRSTGLTQKWVNREISNFDYLMQLNTLAGRTYNDLSQYPVFPWILADYTSDELDLINPTTFRDLSKPIGVVNPKNIPEVKAKYDSFEDPSGTIAKFHYGTHYSNSAGVLHYLVRVEPFTSLHIELQSGRFDVADRQFHSIPQTWKLLMDNPNDVKELTPEFFYFPEFLKNMNGFDLGLLQGTKERVNDVILPKWASSPEDFIYKHRKALESDYVSAHLHEWIDLIFGYKQKGPKAVEALNVFYYCSYEGAVDLDAITNPVEREAVEGMINNFGQTPSQLLKEPHPQRLSLEEAAAKMLKSEIRKVDLTMFLDSLKYFSVEVSNEKDPVVFMSVPRSPPRSFLQVGQADTLLTVSKSGVVGAHSWHSHDRHGTKGFILDVDPTINSAKTRRKIPGPFHPSMPLNSHMFVVSHDAKFLFSGGNWDNSLRVFSLAKNKTVASVRRHFDLVTCVALDQCGSYLVTGSQDTTCIIWDVSHLSSSSSSAVTLAPKPVQTLYGHDRAVTCVGIMTELDMAVSGSLDGTVNVHTIQEGQYVRTLIPVGCEELLVDITYLSLSSQGHVAFAASDKTSHSVHVYSVNGVNLGSKYVSGRVTGLGVAGDLLVVVDDAGDLTMSRLLGLRPVYDVPLHVPLQSVVVTAGNTHLLVPTRDGKIIVLGVCPQ